MISKYRTFDFANIVSECLEIQLMLPAWIFRCDVIFTRVPYTGDANGRENFYTSKGWICHEWDMEYNSIATDPYFVTLIKSRIDLAYLRNILCVKGVNVKEVNAATRDLRRNSQRY